MATSSPELFPQKMDAFFEGKALGTRLGLWSISGRKNVMSMRELFCSDPLTGFEKMAGFQIFYCLKTRFSTHNLERTGNLSSKVAYCGYNLVVT